VKKDGNSSFQRHLKILIQEDIKKMSDEEIVEDVEEEEEEETEIPKRTKSVKAKKYRSAGIKKRKRRATDTYVTYIYKVLKQVHLDLGISNQAMGVMNCFVLDMLEKILLEAGHICKRNNSKTLTAREIEGSAKIVLPNELAKHGISEGRKAVHKFQSYDN